MTHPTKEQIDAAKTKLDISGMRTDDLWSVLMTDEEKQTLRFALRFLRVMLDEPTDGMEKAAHPYTRHPVSEKVIFTAMRDEALKIARV